MGKISKCCAKTDDNGDCPAHERLSRKYFFRQFYVCTVCTSIYFVLGLCFGAPTVFIPQLRKEANLTEPLTDDMASWLSSVLGYSSMPWVIILPILTQYIGRKIPFLIVTVLTIVSFIVFYCSTTAMHLLISEILQGVTLASNMTVLIVIITEYSSPRYRGVFMMIESSIFFWGVWIANVTGTFSHWRNIAIIAFVCCLYAMTAVIMPESPSWLAINGRFDECAVAHHWLKGFDKESEAELENLIKSQKEYLRQCAERESSTSWYKLRIVKETVTAKGFYQPLLLSMGVMSLYHFSGKLVCSMYAVDLIKQITSSESAAYIGMLILDAVTILGMQIGCVLSKILNRRTLLLSSSVLGIIFLFVISLYLYLINLQLISESKIISIVLLTSFSVAITCGPMIMPSTIFGEIIFLRYKSCSLLILTLFSELLMATVLKLAPHLFKALSLHGAFLFYGISASIFAFLLYKYLPETKDKTLQQIENYFKETHETVEEAAEAFINEKPDNDDPKC
ncbi:facilitated trehalose transporter Tret1-2 homolog [Trichoplusia ni]|uniref:Facilitated trehalose transporter Tret1-2 homolog n=1 Tax=Trichoplusia ni TaxID=7111 RepID=A0A7E5VUL5_TRINI|nr:facilitated trehalose transporter Tret1-2 homolog [Trichoplusia ni]XP_026731825.1 facilitated trehalose transporter Tret1-2 homolog [Trichoplusia ni]XP_026731826.1 facilitated trehalose transporter Tret1-2 homolog [Trichoplusia ni]